MKIYHGTTETTARGAIVNGLSPRDDLGLDSNYPNCPSNGEMVYLTAGYAPYYASIAAAQHHGKQWGIVEVDLDYLDHSNLRPDEDFLEQASRHGNAAVEVAFPSLRRLKGMEARTRWFRDHLDDFSLSWEQSIAGLGNCAHVGHVPANAITRVAIYDSTTNPTISWVCIDPSISIMNFQLCSEKYKAITAWMFGDTVDPLSIVNFSGMPSWYAPEMVSNMRAALANTEGLRVLLAA